LEHFWDYDDYAWAFVWTISGNSLGLTDAFAVIVGALHFPNVSGDKAARQVELIPSEHT